MARQQPARSLSLFVGLQSVMSIATAVLVGAAWAMTGCAGRGAPAPGRPAGVTQAGAGPVMGIVVDKNGKPLPDLIVAIGSRRTTSNGDGRFTFGDGAGGTGGDGIPARYDLVVASPSRDHATIYQGITRRDPRVTHAAKPGRPPAHRAKIVGTVRGGVPAGWVGQLCFSSPRTRVTEGPRAGWFDADKGAGAYGPMEVVWDGADTVTGRMLVLLRTSRKDDVASATFADKTVTLRAGQTVTVDLDPVPAPVVPRPLPKVVKPKGSVGPRHEYIEVYQIGDDWAFHGDRFSKTVVDLRTFGVPLCADAWRWDPYLHSRRVHCGFDPERPMTMPLFAPTTFSKPVFGTVATPGMAFGWMAVPNAVYRLLLEPAAGDPTARHPRVEIFTVATEASWPDLAGLAVAFPKPLAGYAASVAAKGPLGSIDELTAPAPATTTTTATATATATATVIPRETWQTESHELSIPVHPPMGKEEAACQYPEGRSVVCEDGGFFVLSAINNKIRQYPDFANAVRIHCVRDCAGARAWARAYTEYSAAHPGFDADQPLEASPPEPPPPPGVFDD